MKNNTLNILWAALLGFTLILSLPACNAGKNIAKVPQEVEGSYAARSKALLWEVRGKELKSPSYLFGTIHMIPEADYFLPEYVSRSMEKAEQVFFEVDLAEANDMSNMSSMMNMMFMEEGTLKDLYSEEDYKLVKEKIASNPMLAMFGNYADRMKPFFLSMLIEQTEGMGANPMMGGQASGIKSYEMELDALAKKAEKPVKGLETLAFQMGMFDRIPLEEQAQMLLDAIRMEDDGKSKVEEQTQLMVGLYKEQDVPGLYRMIQEQMQESESVDFETAFLTERNENWIPIMQEEMAAMPTFFAVGAGHLGGEKGVVSLLRQKGYVVNPVLK